MLNNIASLLNEPTSNDDIVPCIISQRRLYYWFTLCRIILPIMQQKVFVLFILPLIWTSCVVQGSSYPDSWIRKGECLDMNEGPLLIGVKPQINQNIINSTKADNFGECVSQCKDYNECRYKEWNYIILLLQVFCKKRANASAARPEMHWIPLHLLDTQGTRQVHKKITPLGNVKSDFLPIFKDKNFVQKLLFPRIFFPYYYKSFFELFKFIMNDIPDLSRFTKTPSHWLRGRIKTRPASWSGSTWAMPVSTWKTLVSFLNGVFYLTETARHVR